MPLMTIALDLPEGTRISIQGIEGAAISNDENPTMASQIQMYWDEYLSDNGREIFEAAARIQDAHGPGYTLEDIAKSLNRDYESVKSMHRSTGRTKKRWEREQATEAPIQLEWEDYGWEHSSEGQRTRYNLSAEVVNEILALL